MPDQHFTIRVNMKGTAGVVADAKVVSRSNREMAKSTTSVSRAMRDNDSASRQMSRSHEQARGSASGLTRELTGTNARFTALRNLVGVIKWPALITGAGYAAEALGSAGAATIGLTAALAPLAGALTAYPALFGSFAQGAGVMALALGGVMGALGAMETQALGSGEAATSTGKAVRSASEGVVTAERSLQQSQMQARLAQTSLNVARHEAVAELKDLENASVSAAMGEERATLSLREAKQALRKAEAEPSSSGVEIASLELGVREAQQSLHESRLSSRRAHGEAERASTRGVSHNPKVLESNRSLHEAQQGVVESAEGVRKAERGVTEAMHESGGAASTLAKKMAALPPSAQKFAEYLYSLKPRLDELRQTAGANFLPGVEHGINAALPLFPKLNAAVAETGSVMGVLAEEAGEVVGSKGFGKDFESLTKTNTNIIESLGGAGLDLADALRQVMVVAEPLDEWMARMVKVGAEQIDTQTKVGRSTGTMAAFFEDTKHVLTEVFTIGSNVAHAFWDIGKAAKPLGDEILVSFVHSSESLAKWTDSLRGQNELKEYFADAKPGIFEFGRLVRDASEDLIELSQGEGFFTMTKAVRTELLPVMKEVVETTTAAFGPAFVELLVNVGKLLGNLAGTSGPLTLFTEDVSSILGLLNSAFDTIPGLKPFVVTLAGIATTVKALKFAGMVTGLSSSLDLAKKLLVKLGLIEAAGSAGGLVGGGVVPAAEGALTGGVVRRKPLTEAERLIIAGGGSVGTGAAAGGAAKGAGSVASKLGLVGADGAATGLGLATAGVATVTIIAANALIKPDKLGEDQSHEKMLHLKGLEFNVDNGKSEAQFLSLEKSFATTMGKLRTDAAVGMGAINHALGTGLDQANETWAHGTPKWRAHTAEAMRAAVKEIEQGMHSGTIKTKEGEEQINRILSELHLEQGRDPFGLAEATTKQFKQANDITAAGVSAWTKKLEKMPPAAREQTRDATLGMLAAWAEGHPKIEAKVDQLTQYEIRQFGNARSAMEASTSGSMRAISEAVEEGATNVGRGLENVFDNLSGALEAMGSAAIPHFSIKVLSTASQYHHAREATESGLGHPPKKARGGLTRVPGHGREDTVPLTANGSMAAIVAPGEELMVVNRHQRPLLDYAVSTSLGVGGMEGFFGTHDRPHNFAKGGVAVKGKSTPMAELGATAVGKASGVANAYLKAHTPSAGGSIADAGNLQQFNRVYPEHMLTGTAGKARFSEALTAHIAAWAGLPGRTFGQIAHGESDFYPGVYGIDPGGTEGLGLWQITTGYNDERIAKWGGRKQMFNPLKNAKAAKEIYDSQGMGAWYGTKFVTAASGGAINFAKGGIAVGRKLPKGYILPDRAAPPAEIAALRELGVPGLASGGLVEDLLAEARALNGTPYVYGGGHSGSFVAHPSSLDCSAAVSYDLHAANLINEVMASTGLESWGAPGPGTKMTVYANPGHAWMEIEGHPWGTSVGDNGAGGLGFHPQPDSGYKAQFVKRHSPAVEQSTGATGTSVTAQTSAAEAEAEKMPSSYMGCSTQPLTLPTDQPKTLKAVNSEIAQRSGEIHRYAHAAATATRRKKPAIAEALRKNIGLLEARRTQLEHLKVTLKREAAQNRFKRATSRRTERVTGMEEKIEEAQGVYQQRGEFAGQVVALEPVEPAAEQFHAPPRPSLKGLTGAALEKTKTGYEKERAAAETSYEADRRHKEQDFQRSLIGYIQSTEEPAYSKVLGAEAAWRNTVLRAEARAAGNWQDAHRPEGLEGNFEGRIAKLVENEASAKSLIDNANQSIAKWRQEHPNAKQLPSALKALADRREQAKENLKSENEKEVVLRKELGGLRGVFYPGGARITENPTPPAVGSGSFEESLSEVQGPRWPGGHEFLNSLPASRSAGSFGGAIWETQSVIEELGLKVSAATAAIAESEAAGEGGWTEAEEEEARAAEETAAELAAAKEAELALLKERNEALEHEAAVHRAQEPVLADYLGSKLAGGVLPKDGYYFGHRGEEVVRRDESGGGGVHVLEPHIHVSDELAPYISATIEKRFEQGGRKVGLALSTPTAPGRRASMKGGR